MSKLVVKNMHVSVNGKKILKGINLEFEKGKVHVLMGPNGSGKSTLASVLMGDPRYQIDKGKIILDGEDITNLPPNERAKRGLFLSFQYPSEITGVTMSYFLRTACNSIKEDNLNVVDFHRKLKEKMGELEIDKTFGTRYINEGFSGGEKKRTEILQLLVLEPKYAILDETDSGLDVNSIVIVGNAVNKIKDSQRGIFIITHYYRILNYIVPDVASVMLDGKIIKTGGKELAEEIEKNGFGSFLSLINNQNGI